MTITDHSDDDILDCFAAIHVGEICLIAFYVVFKLVGVDGFLLLKKNMSIAMHAVQKTKIIESSVQDCNHYGRNALLKLNFIFVLYQYTVHFVGSVLN